MYLMIRNPGIADHRSFTLVGASTTRNSKNAASIGMFGSGCKYSLSLLLRNGIRPVVYSGNLKMEFFSQPEQIKGQSFNRVCLKYSGKDETGKSKTGIDETSFTLEWGVRDWTNLNMAIREFVSNALDASYEQEKDEAAVELKIVDEPRAKAGYTAIFIPYEPAIEAAYSNINKLFLHFAHPELLGEPVLPKLFPQEKKTYIYKKGVLACILDKDSIYDYNIAELPLDESRNANQSEIKSWVGQVLKHSPAEKLAPVLTQAFSDTKVFENEIHYYSLELNSWDADASKMKENFRKAFEAVAGDKAVITDSVLLANMLKEKGYQPQVVLNQGWLQVLKSYDIPHASKVLTKSEAEGKIIGDPTNDMLLSTGRMWNLLTKLELTNNKSIPTVKSFYSIMDAGGQTHGYHILGDPVIYLHKDLGGDMLDKVTLEELSHYVTCATDSSRDFQDYLLRIIIKMNNLNK